MCYSSSQSGSSWPLVKEILLLSLLSPNSVPVPQPAIEGSSWDLFQCPSLDWILCLLFSMHLLHTGQANLLGLLILILWGLGTHHSLLKRFTLTSVVTNTCRMEDRCPQFYHLYPILRYGSMRNLICTQSAQLLTEIKHVSVLACSLEGISCAHTTPFSERDGNTKEGRRGLDLLGGGSVLPWGACNYPTPGPHSWLSDMI